MTPPTSATIDWLAYTVQPKTFDESMLSHFAVREATAQRHSGWAGAWLDANPRNGYDYTMTAVGREGLAVMFGGAAQRGSVHVSWSGSALKGNDVRERVRLALYAGGRVTRLDLALDVRRRLDFRALYDAARAGRLDTRSKSAAVIDSDTGTTVYIGARSSEQYLRVYDKAAEQGVSGEWTRIELECKGRKANAIANYIVSGSLADIPRIIRAFCDWPNNPMWEEVFAAIPKLGVPQEEKRSDRARWYRETVLPAMQRDCLSGEIGLIEEIAALIAWLPDAEQRRFDAARAYNQRESATQID